MNRQQFPKGGWSFYQPQTKWWAPNPIANTFDQQVINIIQHRLSNRPATIKYQLSTDPAVVGNELEKFNQLRLGLPDTPLPKQTAPARQGGVGAVVAGASNFLTGLENIAIWTDNGRVVGKELAERRAATCAGCPKNGKGDWTRFFTVPASNLIRKQLGMKNDMNLKTSRDDELGVCMACDCPLPLKVWAPLEYALRKISPTVLNDMPDFCWLKTEQ